MDPTWCQLVEHLRAGQQVESSAISDTRAIRGLLLDWVSYRQPPWLRGVEFERVAAVAPLPGQRQHKAWVDDVYVGGLRAPFRRDSDNENSAAGGKSIRSFWIGKSSWIPFCARWSTTCAWHSSRVVRHPRH